jgi:hypothetical protein
MLLDAHAQLCRHYSAGYHTHLTTSASMAETASQAVEACYASWLRALLPSGGLAGVHTSVKREGLLKTDTRAVCAKRQLLSPDAPFLVRLK